LVEQPRVLDGDDRLPGKVADQLDLLVGKRAQLRAIDHDRTDELVLLQHRNRELDARAAMDGYSRRGEAGRRIEVVLHGPDVMKVGRLPRRGDQPESGGVRYADDSAWPALLSETRRDAMQCGDAISRLPLRQEQHAEPCIAEAYGVRQHGLEHRVELAGRA